MHTDLSTDSSATERAGRLRELRQPNMKEAAELAGLLQEFKPAAAGSASLHRKSAPKASSRLNAMTLMVVLVLGIGIGMGVYDFLNAKKSEGLKAPPPSAPRIDVTPPPAATDSVPSLKAPSRPRRD
jgi:hypothetical protein